MRRTIVVLAALATAACNQLPSEKDVARLEAIFAPGQKIAARAKEPDAEVVLQPYDRARDQRAASECQAAYVVLFSFPIGGPITLEEQQRLQIHGRVAHHRIEALVGKPEGTDEERQNDDRFIDVHAYWTRHDYRLNGIRSAEEQAATLYRIRPRIELCDKALEAWGAPKIDEKPDRDYVARLMEN